MRLIDADEAKRFVEENPNNLFIKGFFGVLDEIPTAYDADKVIKQLKENEEDLINPIKENSPSGFYMASVEELKKLFVEYTEEQIKIVKSGSVSDD